MLDEEGRVPKGSDASWFNKVKKKYDSVGKKAKSNWGKLQHGKVGKKSLVKTAQLHALKKKKEEVDPVKAMSTRFEGKMKSPLLLVVPVLRYCGTAVLRYCGTAVLWYCGTVVLWYCVV